jgi:hypothetical protein
LCAAFPELHGFSPRKLNYMRAVAQAWPDAEFVQAVLAQLPWYHPLALSGWAMADIDEDELLADLGLEVAPLKAASRTPREERIVAGFEDILRFDQAHDRAPLHDEDRDIFERLYAVRLDPLHQLPEAPGLLAALAAPGLLRPAPAARSADGDALDEDALLAELGLGVKVADDTADQRDITVLRHVRGSAPKSVRRRPLLIAPRAPISSVSERCSSRSSET